jgi:hypothetical protein
VTRPLRRTRPPGVLARVEEELARVTRGAVAGRERTTATLNSYQEEISQLRACLADTMATISRLEAENAEHAAVRARLERELDERGGEVQALRGRLLEETDARADSEQRAQMLEQELTDLAGDVLVADVARQRRGLFRRPMRAPSARPSASRAAHPEQPAEAADAEGDLDSVLERRLFGT